MAVPFAFHVRAVDSGGKARLGELQTPHGVVATPVFMTVGTRAAVKGVTVDQLRQAGVSMVLCNAYHLALRPGADAVAHAGGLHQFMNWSGPMLTDSGGYQVFSLKDLRRVDDEGVSFRSHIDGAPLRLTPQGVVEIQQKLGADIAMCFDECPPADAPKEVVEAAVERTTRWARQCQAAHDRPDQALFAIVQGGTDRLLRERSAAELAALDFPGYALGGLSVGEEPEILHQTVEYAADLLPADKPRYLMGVGRPEDLLAAVGSGVDMFDCVLPTRNGRNATLFTSHGRLRLRNARYAEDQTPPDPDCACPVCRNYSRAYLRHLFLVDEMLGPTLASIHNLAFYADLTARMRDAIAVGRYADFRTETLAKLASGDRAG